MSPTAVPLAPLTTLRLGGPAARLVELEREEDVVEAVHDADTRGEPLFVLGGGSNEGLFGVTYEVVGTPGQPVLRVNPISAMAPGVLRKIFEFNTGKQNNSVDFQPNN